MLSRLIITFTTLDCQTWDKLVLGPLRQVCKDVFPLPIVIVVDALDECDNENDISLLIQCLAAATAVESIWVRVLVTSRPEQPINLGFDSISRDAHQDFILHDIEQSIVDQDLTLFYKDRLTYTLKRFGLDDHVLSNDTIKLLVKKSSGLFIHAATVCRFIHEGRQRSGERLSLVIAAGNAPTKAEKSLDQMYATVLTHSLTDQLDPDETARAQALFSRIVGSILVLSDAMTLADLATMLEAPKSEITSTLHCLHSVLEVPADQTRPIRLLHPSFRDFLLDPDRCRDNAFSIKAKSIHTSLFNSCLKLMREHLRHNMCDLAWPGTRTRDVSKAVVDQFISLPVQYACRYWIHHLQQSDIDANDCPVILDFFHNYFLRWLEVLALIGRLSEGITLIRLLEARLATPLLKGAHSIKCRSMFSWIKARWLRNPTSLSWPPINTYSVLHSTVYDALRFLLSHSSIIEVAPLQTYCSALLFSPKNSLIRQHYSDQIPNWILGRPITREYWSPYLQILSHSSLVTAVAFSPDGKVIASASGDRTVRLWDLTTGTERRVFRGHLGWVWAVAFSPDNQLVASTSDDGTVRFWDATVGTQRLVFRGHLDRVRAVTFTLDGRLVASASDDRTVRLWNATTGTERLVFRGHAGRIWAVAFSPDGRLVASASDDETVRLWDATTGTERHVLRDHLGSVWAIAFSPDGRLIASGSNDRTVRIWDATTGSKRSVFRSHSGRVKAVAFSPDGRLVASASGDRTVRLWEAITGTERRVFQGHFDSISSIAYSPDGRLVASASSDRTVRLWDATATGRCVSRDHLDWVRAVAFSPDGRLVASTSGNWIVRLWDATTGTASRVLRGHSNIIRAVTFSPDSRLVASASDDETVRLWDAITGIGRHVFRGHLDAAISIAFSPDGRLVASGSNDRTVRLWDTTTGTERCVFRGHSGLVWAATFSPDGHLIASGSNDRTVRLWDVITGTERRVFRGHSGRVKAIAFSPDGQLIASASGDRTVRLWDATTGAERRVFRGHSDTARSVAFSPDGWLIASASDDKTVRLWDVSAGLEQHVYTINAALRCLFVRETHLVTDLGILRLPQIMSQPQRHIFISGNWVLEDAADLLFIHPDYRDSLVFVSGNNMVFDIDSRSSVLQFGCASKSTLR